MSETTGNDHPLRRIRPRSFASSKSAARGWHARASAKFVQTVERFEADVRVTRGGETVGGDSIMGLMMLAACRAMMISVEATGVDAAAVVDALAELVSSRFAEES